MTTFVMPIDILELPPKERVIAAGIALLKHDRKMPTQDQLVQALIRSEGEKGTGKGTVNKYWSSLQNEIARELSLAEWLPAELPEFVIDHLKQLIDWARKDADAQLVERQSALNERKRKLDEEVEARKATEAMLRNRIEELEVLLKRSDEAVDKLRDKQTSLEQSLGDAQRMVAVQEEKLSYSEKLESKLSSKVTELKSQVRITQELMDEKELELQAYKTDILQLENQLQSLQHQYDEQLRLGSSLKDQVTGLKEQIVSSDQAVKDIKSELEDSRKSLQLSETRMARQEGKLAILDTLQSSVGTLKAALIKEQERCQSLERVNKFMAKQLKKNSLKTKKKDK